MESVLVRSALISTDEQFRSLVRDVLHRSNGIQLVCEVTVPTSALDEEHVQLLRTAAPELVFLDLEPDPAIGIRFAQFFSDQFPGRRIIATGPQLSSEQMLHALRAGISDYLPKPSTPEGLAAAVEGVVRKLRRSPSASPSQPGKLFAVFSAKGGSGATTVATNLAIYLHQLTGRRALLVDLDLELGEIALQLGVEPRFTFIDMVRNFHRMDTELLASFIEHHPSGVHVLSAPYHPQKTEVVTGEQIARILQFLKQHYDYVVVDTSKSFSPPTLATFEQADVIYLVTTVDLPSLRNIARCLPLLREMAAPVEERLRLVLNRQHDNDVLQAEDVERSLGLKVYHAIGNDYAAVINSLNTGTPLILGGDTRYARDLRALGAEIVGLQVRDEARSQTATSAFIEPLARVWRRTIQPFKASA